MAPGTPFTRAATLTVRPARTVDAAQLVELFRQLGYAADGDALHARLVAGEGAGVCTLVAQAGDKLAGVIVIHLMAPLHVAGRWALVSALVVDETLRGGGVGARLLSAAEGFAAKEGCSQIELSSSLHRTGAHAFYEQQGFDEVRKRFLKRLVQPHA